MCDRFTAVMLSLALLPISPTWADTQCAVSESHLRGAIEEIHTKQENVGLAAAIVRGDQVIFDQYLGLANVDFNVPINERTIFGIASVTKLYTAVTLLQLRAEGRIDLDDIVQEHLPEFPRKPEGDISLEMLAMHTSGIPHPQSIRTPELYATHFETATDAIDLFAHDLRLQP